MVLSGEYFEIAGALLALYGFFRIGLWLSLGRDYKPLPSCQISDCEGHPIDTSQLAERLRAVRQDFAAEAHPRQTDSLKRPLLLESKREEIARLAFFQKPPPSPEPPPDEQHFPLILAL